MGKTGRGVKKGKILFSFESPYYWLMLALLISLIGYGAINRFAITTFFVSQDRRNEIMTPLLVHAKDFFTLTSGIIIEAFPFVILGALVSVIVRLYLPPKVLQRLPKNPFLRRISLSFLGVLMPVCECGNIPVARSLMASGLTKAEAIVFLLCAPSINFVTFFATWEAFRQDHMIAVYRIAFTLIIANITALLITRFIRNDKILTEDFTNTCRDNKHHDKSLRTASDLFMSEIWSIARLLIIGASIAALSQLFIPRDAILYIASDPFLAVIAMLVLAFIVSICSSVDAFFALAYANTFGGGALLAFLVAGPMVDIKILTMLKSTFTTRTILLMSASVLILTLVCCVGISYLIPGYGR